MRTQKLTARHAGDFGDMICFLPVLAHICKYLKCQAEFFIEEGWHGQRQILNQRTGATIAPLIASLPYISKVTFAKSDKIPKNALDGNLARRFAHANNPLYSGEGITLVDWACLVMNVPLRVKDEAWFKIKTKPSGLVIVNRTQRYNNPLFPWPEVLKKYKGQMAFIGTQTEFNAFTEEFTFCMPHISTPTLLDAAYTIASARLFIGNQSACHCIAEGLKRSIVLEVAPAEPFGMRTMIFNRPGVVNGYDESVLAKLP